MMPIPYTPRDDGQPLTAEELYAFKTVSDIDRSLSEEEARIVELHFKHYLHQMRGSFKIYLRRSARFMPYVKQVFASRGIPDDIAYLFMVESGGNPVAQSHAGAVGLWQFMPGTAKIYGLQQDNWLDERRDPYKATVAAANYLKRLHREFCNWHLAVAAYNAGEGKIGRAVTGTGASDFFDLCRLDAQLEARARLKDETRDYVPRLIAVAKIMRNLDRLNLMKPTDEMAWSLAPMNVPPLTDLHALARQLGLSWEEFSAANPAYLRAASPPQQTIAYVPPEKLGEAVRWAATPEARIYAGWKEHVVRKGDSLSALAKRNKVSVEAIRKANLIAALPKQGQAILIPGEKPLQPQVAALPAVQPDTAALASAWSLRASEGGLGQFQPGVSPGTRAFFTSPIEKHASSANAPVLASSVAPRLSVPAEPGPAAPGAMPTVTAEKGAPKKTSLAASKPEAPPAALAASEKTQPAPRKAAASSEPAGKSPAKAALRHYIVQPGDTLYGIARQWGVAMADIQAANKMAAGKTSVRIGQKLLMPERAAAPAQEAVAEAKAPQTQAKAQNVAALTPSKEAAARDSFEQTAWEREALAFNPLTGGVDEREFPRAGQGGAYPGAMRAEYDEASAESFFSERELILGSYMEAPPPFAKRERPALAPAGQRERNSAPMGYAISMDALEPADFDDPDDDSPKVFLNVYVKHGESLEDIARANGVPVRVLRQANRLGIHDRLEAGQKILVPKS